MTSITRSQDKVQTAQDLWILFNLSPEFENYTPFNDSLGFSVQRKYPGGLAYKPPVKEDGTPDTVALIRVLYDKSKISQQIPQRVPLRFSIGAFSRYLSNHFDYQWANSDCPTQGSVELSRKTPSPYDLEIQSAYFYDCEKNQIVDKQGTTQDGCKILNTLFTSHIETIEGRRARIFRFKLASANACSRICEWAEKTAVLLMPFMTGRRIAINDLESYGLSCYKKNQVRFLKTESINVFGYRAAKQIILIYCSLLLAFSFWITVHPPTPRFLSKIASNDFLGFAACIVTLAIIDWALPFLFFHFINLMIRAKLKLMFKTFTF